MKCCVRFVKATLSYRHTRLVNAKAAATNLYAALHQWMRYALNVPS